MLLFFIYTGDDENKNSVLSYVIGDIVQITGGELKNLIGRVIDVNELIKSVTITPFNNILKNEIVVESHLLVKYIVAGAHIKVRENSSKINLLLFNLVLLCVILRNLLFFYFSFYSFYILSL